MNVPGFIARRHLLAKKSRGIINYISLISMFIMAFVTAAMVIVISAFNGIDELVKSLFADFDAPLTILPAEGVVMSDSLITTIPFQEISGILAACPVIEQNVWIQHQDKNAVAIMKGLDPSALRHLHLKGKVFEGDFVLQKDSFDFAIPGWGIVNELGLEMRTFTPPSLDVRAPIPGKKLSRDRENAFESRRIICGALFSVNAELDSRYILTSLRFAKDVCGYDNQISAIEVFLQSDADSKTVKKKLETLLPDNVSLISREEKNALVFKANASEKWATFLILLFIMLIASFNIAASLTMLIIEKRKDIRSLVSMGMTHRSVEKIFITEALWINFSGAFLGIALGLITCYSQIRWGLIPMEGAMVEFYPIKIIFSDILLILFSVSLIGLLISQILVRALVRRFLLKVNLLRQ